MIQTSTLTDIIMNGEKTRRLLLWQNGMHVIIEWEMYRFQMVLENELDRLFQRFCIHWFHLRLEWPLCICTEMMDSHTVMNGMCDTKKGVTCLSVIIWRSVEELRCLFVREGWSECFLGLWRDSCSWMPLEDTHRWDGACLNIISLWMRITLKSDVTRKTECVTILAFSSEWCEFGQV